MIASASLLLVNAMHGLDHVRQGLDRLTSEVAVGGGLLLMLAVIPFAAAFLGHRLAPLLAAAVGFWTALAVAASHLAPHWSAFSDPYADNDLDVLAWALMLTLLLTAVALGMVGIRALRRGGKASDGHDPL